MMDWIWLKSGISLLWCFLSYMCFQALYLGFYSLHLFNVKLNQIWFCCTEQKELDFLPFGLQRSTEIASSKENKYVFSVISLVIDHISEYLKGSEIWMNNVTFLLSQRHLLKSRLERGARPTPEKRSWLKERKRENDDNLSMIEQFPMEGRLLVVETERDLLLCCL